MTQTERITIAPSKGLNEKQLNVVNSIEGIYVVDAGAGTGKTTAITKRYEKILDAVGDPNRILLLTFTDNAAENMRSKIIKECGSRYNINKLKRAPISTFHSFCNKLIKKEGLKSPSYLGIDGVLQNPAIIEKNVYEKQFFRRFFNNFRAEHQQYMDIYKVIKSDGTLALIKKLCCKGIFPTRRGWFNNGAEMLYGELELYKKKKFDVLNEPINNKPSKLLKKFNETLKDGHYLNLPIAEISDDTQVTIEAMESAFSDDRTLLTKFIHDIYFGYIQYCVKMNRINFDFMIMFAFILLYYNHHLRQSRAFDYVMVDEFQDTNEIQFMMVLMLMKTNNLCVVGDWKQGIYAFRNATIDNILDFDEKLKMYKQILNNDYERIAFDVTADHREFDINYRSSQDILNFSEKSLKILATDDDFIDEDISSKITHLESAHDLNDRTRIEFLLGKDREDEQRIVLAKIQEIINSENYLIKELKDDVYETRKAEFRDIVVLCRVRSFGLELQDQAIKLGMPANYDGGIELFKTEPALLVLAWLRLIIDGNNQRGWIPILEKEGYNYPEIKHIIAKQYPKNLVDFRKELLKERKDIVSLIGKIMKFHNLSGNHANAVVVNIQALFGNVFMQVSELINFIEENIETKETYEVDVNLSDDAVTIQTIHGAKGLEYPIVIIANINQAQFPSHPKERSNIFYHDLVGLRIKDEFGEKNGYKSKFDKWQTDLLTTHLFADYDEERRLLYVATTRAKQYLVFTANQEGSKFFKQMADGFDIIKNYDNQVSTIKSEKQDIHDDLSIGNYEKRGIVLAVHDIMKYKHPNSGKGKDFGNALHSFAHRLVLGINGQWDQPEADKIKKFIDSLNADELISEIECSLPVGDNLIRGEIDLLAIYNDRIEIIDYKSDMDYLNEVEYIKQLSVYYHVVQRIYLDKRISCSLYYVCLDEIKEIKPLLIDDITILMNSVS
jgi:ATP-dependent helicase/nuclease subunit A